MGTPYLRLLRPGSLLPSDAVQANDTKEAARLLENMPGNVLLTTGSKELGVFASVTGFDSRFFARMLPMGTAVEEADTVDFNRGGGFAPSVTPGRCFGQCRSMDLPRNRGSSLIKRIFLRVVPMAPDAQI